MLLVFAHLLGMATLVAAFLLQRRTAPGGPLVSLWVSGAAVQLITGLALLGIEPLTDAGYDYIKTGLKLVVALVVAGLAVSFRRAARVPPRLVPAMAGLVVLNVGLAVFWT